MDFQSVPYLRNPNYDGWFDIQIPRLQVGHCAISLADAIDNAKEDASLIPSTILVNLKTLSPCLKLLGFSLLEAADDLLELTAKLEATGIQIDKAVVCFINFLLKYQQ